MERPGLTENPAVDANTLPSAAETMQASTTFPFPTKVRSTKDCQFTSAAAAVPPPLPG